MRILFSHQANQRPSLPLVPAPQNNESKMGKVLSKLFPLNRSREATGAPTQVLSKIDMSLVEEAWQFGTLLRRIEDDAATLLSLLQERLPVGQASPIIEQWRRIQNVSCMDRSKWIVGND